jgi:hypothetical protein
LDQSRATDRRQSDGLNSAPPIIAIVKSAEVDALAGFDFGEIHLLTPGRREERPSGVARNAVRWACD